MGAWEMNEKLDVIIPPLLDVDWMTADEKAEEIIEQHKLFGFTKFILAAPNKGHLSVGYPTKEDYQEKARMFAHVKKKVEPYGIECGWWFFCSVKSGPKDTFTSMVRQDGTQTPLTSCPLDPVFREQVSSDMAMFCEIAKPAFVFLEDDFTIHSSTGKYGCFCEHHLSEFAKRQGKYYSREELIEIFEQKTPESIQLLRGWKELIKDSLVLFAESMRRAVDAVMPGLPIGSMQSWFSDNDGDCTYEVAKALAGEHHVPYSRIFGVIYHGASVRGIPTAMFHPIYTKQHIKDKFTYYFESDCFPHTRFFSSAKEIQAQISAMYFAGFDGSTLQTSQGLDDANEDAEYGYAFVKAFPQYEAIHQIAKQCELKGVEICYDPFYNTIDRGRWQPYWTQTVSYFGIPFTSQEEKVAFWDKRQAQYYSEETTLHYLEKTLFLDGEAAKVLCERGFREYLGVDVGNDLTQGSFKYDSAAKEVICDGYALDSRGRNMMAPHFYAVGKEGKEYDIIVRDPKCEILTEIYTYNHDYVCPGMTRYKNKLGGTVIIMSMSIAGTDSCSLFNYRRQQLFRQLISEACDEFVIVKNAPCIFTLMNEPIEKQDYIGALYLNNLSSDEQDKVTLHFPAKWEKFKELKILNAKGEWIDVFYERVENEITLHTRAKYLEPVYVLVK